MQLTTSVHCHLAAQVEYLFLGQGNKLQLFGYVVVILVWGFLKFFHNDLFKSFSASPQTFVETYLPQGN